ncbi:MAG: ClpXP protease specificity-enhancing factor SspB [Hyphomicrobium sp.]
MPAEPTIDYESLAQDALRGLVRTVLIQTAKSGLPGEHHFYISFDTTATGVVLSKRLKQKYPQEMTVVLQHRFWDLIVQDDRFEVKLTFDGIPERLVVPFAAIRVFFDPSVRYGLQFEDADVDPETGEPIEEPFRGRSTGRPNGTRNTLRSTAPKKPRVPRKAKGEKRSTSATAASSSPARVPKGARTPAAETMPEAPAQSGSNTDIPAAAEQTTADDAPRQDNGGAQIVSLDAFRKK